MEKESENPLLPADGASVIILFAPKGHLEVERSTQCWNNRRCNKYASPTKAAFLPGWQPGDKASADWGQLTGARVSVTNSLTLIPWYPVWLPVWKLLSLFRQPQRLLSSATQFFQKPRAKSHRAGARKYWPPKLLRSKQSRNLTMLACSGSLGSEPPQRDSCKWPEYIFGFSLQ